MAEWSAILDNGKRKFSAKFVRASAIAGFSLTLGFATPALVPAAWGQSQPAPAGAASEPGPTTAAGEQTQAADQAFGAISGTIVDQSGAVVAGAVLTLTHPGQTTSQDVVTDEGGQFYFVNVTPGPYEISINTPGFTAQTLTGTLAPGEVQAEPKVVLMVAATSTVVHVTVTQEQIADEQVKVQEKQRVLGILPNFFVTYDPNAAPLNARQKFSLAWRTSIDPVTILTIGAIAGEEQRTNSFSGYGQGAAGYFKRFGATYATVANGTFLGGAVFPTLLKQDPRYFYKGTGSFRSRLLYALRNSFVAKGDNKEWQPNYSNILGNLTAGAIANAYYPANKRGVGLTFETAGIRIGETMVAGVFQEFFSKKLTPNSSRRTVTPPQP